MISQGLELMLYGMGTVVVFLTLLVVSTSIMSRAITRYFPEDDVAPGTAVQTASRDENLATVEPQLIAVITAAINRHRNR